MTFSIVVPNASQSPGLFPTQNNTNFQRLKDIINNDHNFLDTAGATQGYHKKVSFQNLSAIPVGLAGANSILYSLADSDGNAQLNFYNGVINQQLTPLSTQYPIRVVGSMSLASGASTTAYADPGYRWAGTGWAIAQGKNIYNFYNLMRCGGNNITLISSNTGSVSRPTFSFSGNDLEITNNDGTTLVVVWSLIINRIV